MLEEQVAADGKEPREEVREIIALCQSVYEFEDANVLSVAGTKLWDEVMITVNHAIVHSQITMVSERVESWTRTAAIAILRGTPIVRLSSDGTETTEMQVVYF